MADKIKAFFKSFARILVHGKTKDKVIAWCIIIALCSFISYDVYKTTSTDTVREIPTSTFVYQLDNGNVSELHISNSDGSVSGKLINPDADYADGVSSFTSHVPERSDVFAEKYLSTGSIQYDYEKSPAWVTALLSLLAGIIQIVILVVAMAWLISRMQGDTDSMLPFGTDDDNEFGTSIPDTTFDDVAGIPEAIEEVSEIVTFLKNPKKYDDAGAKCPRGILMEGSPGTGKTLLARALAGEAGVNFISASGSDFVKIYVGQGAKKVRELFAKARKSQPAIIFIDEIDAVGGARSETSNGTDSEQLRTINALLAEMDGFRKNDHIVVIAATNRADTLDPALMRPGRFDRIISIDTPAMDGRIEILKHYAQGKPFADPVDFKKIAKHTYGFSGAQLENVMNEASILAARRAVSSGEKPAITEDDIEEGISRTISGPALKSKRMGDEERRQVAYHEAGHAVVQYLLPGCDPVQKISIVSRKIPSVGTALGYVQSYSEEDSYVTTADELKSEIAALLAGRCSENLYCGIESAGASDDLKKASRIAYSMVDRYAFKAPDGSQSWRVAVVEHGHSLASEKHLEYIDETVDNILNDAYQVALKIVTEHKDDIKRIVDVLLEKETIDSDGINEIMSSIGNENGDAEKDA